MVHINKKYFTAVLSLFFITLLSHACAEETTIGRVVYFPTDESVGTVSVQDKNLKREIETFYYWIDGANFNWEIQATVAKGTSGFMYTDETGGVDKGLLTACMTCSL